MESDPNPRKSHQNGRLSWLVGRRGRDKALLELEFNPLQLVYVLNVSMSFETKGARSFISVSEERLLVETCLAGIAFTVQFRGGHSFWAPSKTDEGYQQMKAESRKLIVVPCKVKAKKVSVA